jgi:glycerol-3-phosphate O-acyltransferase
VRQEIRDTRRTRRDGLLVARRHALEIAANYSHTFVRIAERILSRFLTRVYDGIEVRNAEYLDPPAARLRNRLHALPPEPRGLPAPVLCDLPARLCGAYVAAGLNLNLPVIGRLLRKGGAFYIAAVSAARASTRSSS